MNTSDNADTDSSTAADPDSIVVRVATTADAKYAFMITKEMSDSANARALVLAIVLLNFFVVKWIMAKP